MSGSGFRSLGRQANLVRRAFGGDAAAVRELVTEAVGIHREKFLGIRQELDYHREHTWDDGAARKRILEGDDVPPEQVLGAFAELHRGLLRLTSSLTVMLMADDDELDVWEDRVRSSAFDLFLLLHAPEIRYSIIGGFRPELREDVDNYFDRMGLELWGTIDGLLQDGEITLEDFPPETQAVMQHHAEHAAEHHDLDADEE